MKIYNTENVDRLLLLHGNLFGPRPNGFIVYPNDGPTSLYRNFFIPDTPHWFKILKTQYIRPYHESFPVIA